MPAAVKREGGTGCRSGGSSGLPHASPAQADAARAASKAIDA